MPKVYISKADRQEARIIRGLTGMAKGKQKELADLWGISPQGVSYRLNKGYVTVLDLWKANKIFNGEEIADLINGKG